MSKEESAAYRLVQGAAHALEYRGEPIGADSCERRGPEAPREIGPATTEWSAHILELLDLGFTTRDQLEAVVARFLAVNLMPGTDFHMLMASDVFGDSTKSDGAAGGGSA